MRIYIILNALKDTEEYVPDTVFVFADFAETVLYN